MEVILGRNFCSQWDNEDDPAAREVANAHNPDLVGVLVFPSRRFESSALQHRFDCSGLYIT